MNLFITFLTLFIGLYCYGQQYIYPDSLQGYYPFGLQGALDVSGNNNNPSIIGSYSSTSSAENSDGYYWLQGGYIDIGDVDTFEGTDSLTLFSFILTDFVNFGGNNNESEFAPIISKWTIGNVANSSYRVYLNGNRLVAEFSDGVSSDSLSYDIWQGTLCCNWTPITIVFESGQVHIFEFWIEVASKSLSTSSINNSTASFYLGNMNHHINPNYQTFSGSIDETMVYNRALSLCEFSNFHLENWTYPLNNSWSSQCNCLTAQYFQTDSYQWYDCDNQVELFGETNATLAPQIDGNYACIVNYHGGCIDTTECFEVTGLGLNAGESNYDFEIYPNPSNGEITISLNSAIQPTTIQLLDLNGRVLTSMPYSEQVSFNQEAGVYLIKILDDRVTLDNHWVIIE